MNARNRKKLLNESALATPVSGMRGMWDLITAYWKSDQRKEAWLLAGTFAALTVASSLIAAKTGFIMKDVTDVLTQKDAPLDLEFARDVLGLLALSLAVNPWISSKIDLAGNLLNISWCGWLTDKFNRAANTNNAFYHIRNIPGPVHSPDLAIAQAPRDFTANATGLGMGAFSSLLRIGTFTGVLASICDTAQVQLANMQFAVPGATFWMIYGAAAVFAGLQTKLFQHFGTTLAPLEQNQNLTEGTFRAKLLGVFKEASKIAPYGGKAVDRHKLADSFEQIQENSRNLARANFKYNFSTRSFLQTTNLSYFLAGGIVHKFSSGMSWGTAGQLTQSFFELQNGFAWWGNVVPGIAKAKAHGKLLTDLANQIEQAQNPKEFYARKGRRADIQVSEENRESILLQDVVLDHPASGKPMIRIPRLEINPGDRIMITAKSGSGKSCLMSACAGLFFYGTGRISLPKGKEVFLGIPYVLPDATLKENIAFRNESSAYDHSAYVEALQKSELDELIPFLDQKKRHENDWHSLSDGEKQRLVFARIFLQKPNIVFLDEATSAMDKSLEKRLSERLVASLPQTTIISNAHNDLSQYHTKRINIADDGQISTYDLAPVIRGNIINYSPKKNM